MRRIARQPRFWFAAFTLWFVTLWWLSSQVNHFPPALDFQFSDKFLHFGYFFGGGVLFSAFLYRLKPRQPDWRKVLMVTLAVVSAVGMLDEWHQSHVPGRSGNDPADLTADVLGALCGALFLRKGHRMLA